jgi:hypothetical protein
MGYGYELFNDPLVRIPDIARIIGHYGEGYIVAGDESGFFDDPPAFEPADGAGLDSFAVGDLDELPGSGVGGGDYDGLPPEVSTPVGIG